MRVRLVETAQLGFKIALGLRKVQVDVLLLIEIQKPELR